MSAAAISVQEKEIVELERLLPDSHVLGPRDVSAIAVNGLRLPCLRLEPLCVVLVVEDQEGEGLMVMQVIDQAENGTETILFLSSRSVAYAAQHDDLDTDDP